MYYEYLLIFTFLFVFLNLNSNYNILFSYIPIFLLIFSHLYLNKINLNLKFIKLNFESDIYLIFSLILLLITPISIYFAQFYNSNISKIKKNLILFSILNAILLGASNNYFTSYILYECLSVLAIVLVNYNQFLYITTKYYLAFVMGPGFLLIFEIIFDFSNSITPYEFAIFSKTKLLFIVLLTTKTAIFPFSFWILSAMEAPHYISALLHSSLVVKAGLIFLMKIFYYNIITLSSQQSIITMFFETKIELIPTFTILIISIFTLFTNNLKLLLASSTIIHISQMILLMLMQKFGLLYYYIFFHGIFKFILFAHLGYVYKTTSQANFFYISSPSFWEKIMIYFSITGLMFLSGLPLLYGSFIKQVALSSCNPYIYLLITCLSYIYNMRILRAILQEKSLPFLFIITIFTFVFDIFYAIILTISILASYYDNYYKFKVFSFI